MAYLAVFNQHSFALNTNDAMMPAGIQGASENICIIGSPNRGRTAPQNMPRERSACGFKANTLQEVLGHG